MRHYLERLDIDQNTSILRLLTGRNTSAIRLKSRTLLQTARSARDYASQRNADLAAGVELRALGSDSAQVSLRRPQPLHIAVNTVRYESSSPMLPIVLPVRHPANPR